MRSRNLISRLFLLAQFGLNTTLMGAASLVTSLFSATGARSFARWWAAMNMYMTGMRVVVKGLDNLPDDRGGVIIASNHSSAADIAALLGGLPLDICWVTKASLTAIPFLGWHLSRVHVPVARSSAGNTRRLLDQGAEKIRNGAAVTIFPEGTRNRQGGLLPFKKGAFLLARASGRPVIPTAIIGADRLWPEGRSLPSAGVITVRLGEPIWPDADEGAGGDEEAGLRAMAGETRTAVARLKELGPA